MEAIFRLSNTTVFTIPEILKIMFTFDHFGCKGTLFFVLSESHFVTFL